jgi:hypothetical protein
MGERFANVELRGGGGHIKSGSTHLTRSLLQVLFTSLVALVAASHLARGSRGTLCGEVGKAVDAVDVRW